ncbi:MAG TPA: hypothetical protein VFV64_09455 [Permianibacter sp.]|nr:hypothetical protein [Permianibacter sp.]
MKSCLSVSLLVAVWLATPAVANEASRPAPNPERNQPLLAEAESQFFQALNEKPKRGKNSLEGLTLAYAVAPTDGRTNLLLGLNHLWLAAEAPRNDPMTLQHVILSDYFLDRAERLTGDYRIPSWRISIQLTLARRDGDQKAVDRHYAEFVKAYKKNPDFHSFVLALLAFDEPVDSKDFQRGLKAMRATESCGEHNPSCQNLPRWPHNVEAYAVFMADFEAKAGDEAAARKWLALAEQYATATGWAYLPAITERQQHLPERMARYANTDRQDDPAGLFDEYQQETCQLCHRQ